MRLLNTRTLTLTTFIGETPEYVILSHRWEDEEVLFEDVMKVPISDTRSPARAKRGFSKVQGTCALALRDGFDWVWIDNCCIDKASSTELQEAINSMFRWYQEAQVCYAYLSDVPDEQAGCDVAFGQSLWFTRGWTLQELLAPYSVEFYAADWAPIGSKATRADQIASIAGINLTALKTDWVDSGESYVAAEKMSWAAHRLVTRPEDMAYCLLGLFDATMPLLYGEGGPKAFRRLQQVVFESEIDYSLFLYSNYDTPSAPSIASSTSRFCRRPSCKDCARSHKLIPEDIMYNHMCRAGYWKPFDDQYLKLVKGGVTTKMLLYPYTSGLSTQSLGNTHPVPPATPDTWVALLPWTLDGRADYVFGIVLVKESLLGYLRYDGIPILVHTDIIGDRAPVAESFAIYDEPFEFLSILAVSGHHYALFDVRSCLFQAFTWSCAAGVYWVSSTSREATFHGPESFDGHYAVTLKASSAVLNLSLVIVLEFSSGKLRLRDVKVDGERFLWRAASLHSRVTDRLSIPHDAPQGYINVALRHLSPIRTQDASNSEKMIYARHRVEIGFVKGIIQPSEPENTYVGVAATRLGIPFR